MKEKWLWPAAACLLLWMFFAAGSAAMHESMSVDEVAHVGAGLSYLQRLDLRLNPEHPPLGKAIAALPLALRGAKADYQGPAWNLAVDPLQAYTTQWVFGDSVLGRWNPWRPTLLWARAPMLMLTLLLGVFVFVYATKLGGAWGGLLCLTVYVTTPAFLAFGPLVITDVPVTLFTLVALWQLGELWAKPNVQNTWLFAIPLAAALLSKFTGLLLIPVVLVLFLYTRFRRTGDEPLDNAERKLWRRARWRRAIRGCLYAAAIVYFVYLFFSWNQPTVLLSSVGRGWWGALIQRALMPIVIYIVGLAWLLLMGSRSTYLLGHNIAHGVPYYFPFVFVLKSTLGFLLLLVLAAAVAIYCKRRRIKIIPERYAAQWRALMIGFFVLLVVCLASQLNIGIRHFLLPIVLMILMLAPLPQTIRRLPRAQLLGAVTAVLAAGCFVSVLMAYPYYFPYVNALSFGRPAYYLLNDSNVTWNEALPSLQRFMQEQQLSNIKLDYAALSDPVLVVPQAEVWDCQAPAADDAGHWVAVTAVSILENHNCSYLQQYPHQALAGGSLYVFKLPASLPASRCSWGAAATC